MNIVITLDYELFLNDRTGSVENCLVRPTRELDIICKKHNIHVTIFVDAAYLYMLNKLRSKYPSLQEDYENMVENVLWLKQSGHDIQLHIHPQWYYSSYDGKEWHLDWDHYKLSDMPKDEAFVLFKTSKELLDNIIGEKTVAFRAGGYSIQEFDYLNCFMENGIIGDSSVLPGSFAKEKTHSFDYRNSSRDAYYFRDDLMRPTACGGIKEFPISTAPKVFIIKYLKIKWSWMTRDNVNWGDGGNNPIHGIIPKIKSYLHSFELYKIPHGTIDYQSFFFLRKALENSSRYDTMTIIGHPKNFSMKSLEYLDKFIDDAHEQQCSFKTIKALL